MQEKYYTDDRNTQILLALLKEHGIKRVIASPGTTNIALVASMQYDSWFDVYSSVDERSAAYMACGMAESTGEPVILSCTGATASRNYFPGLTEAYYRKLPIIAVTGSHGDDIKGHLYAQSIDRSQAPKDTVIFSSVVKRQDSEWKATIEINKAILALAKNGGGPVHLDLESAAYGGFTTKELPNVRKIDYYGYTEEYPNLSTHSKVAIFIGAHVKMSDTLSQEIDKFCELYNSVVFSDITSGYYGKYRVHYALITGQEHYSDELTTPDILIHLGEVSGDMYTTSSLKPKETWRISPDGEIKDLFSNLTKVFGTSESYFFERYNKLSPNACVLSYYDSCISLYREALTKIPDLPFGNIWVAKQLYSKIPQNSVMYCAILNTLRSWNFFEVDPSIEIRSNVGGFGIDGTISTLLGASLVQPDKLHFCFLGDLAFFYDMNSLGNRHLGSNVRILLINNGKGTEFRNYDHPGSRWGTKADDFIAAGGHFGRKSSELVKHYAQDLGFKYLSANNKREFEQNSEIFIDTKVIDSPIVFEVFTDSDDESRSLKIMRTLLGDNRGLKEKVASYGKNAIKKILNK